MADDDDEEEFARTHARETDPDTSHDAAKQQSRINATLRARIVAFLKKIWPQDANWWEITIGTGIREPWKRCSELLEDKAIEVATDADGKVVKRKTGRKAMARCYRLVEREPRLL